MHNRAISVSRDSTGEFAKHPTGYTAAGVALAELLRCAGVDASYEPPSWFVYYTRPEDMAPVRALVAAWAAVYDRSVVHYKTGAFGADLTPCKEEDL